MNIEIEMSGFDAVLNEAMKIVAPETLEAANPGKWGIPAGLSGVLV